MVPDNFGFLIFSLRGKGLFSGQVSSPLKSLSISSGGAAGGCSV